MHKLSVVIKAIGGEWTQKELIPWLEDHISGEKPKFDDEVLLAFSEELTNHWNKFGLWDEWGTWFSILQKLTWIEESHVWEQATKCLISISKEMSISEVNSLLTPFVLTLSNDTWFTGWLSACSLIPPAYKHLPKQKN